MVMATSSSIVPRTLAALQKVATNQLRTATAAAMAMPLRAAGSVPRQLFCHGHCLIHGQQTIPAIPWGTLMRHVILAHPVAA
jgi:hypothetical protein